MKRKIKFIFFLVLFSAQILSNLYLHSVKLHIDFLFLIMVYIAIKSGIIKTIASAIIIGWITDYFSIGSIGIFGFSRTVVAFLLFELSRFIDLKNSFYTFLLIFLSLSVSNLIANLFLLLIHGVKVQLHMILFQPLLTGFMGIILISPKKIKKRLDVY